MVSRGHASAAVEALLPKVAAATAEIGGVLVGGTVLALQLQHRPSYDLGVLTLADFDSRAVADRLAESADFFHEVMVEPNGVRVLVDGLDVQVWKSEDGDVPVETGPIVSGMRLASLPDLFALKLHTVGRRAQFRDYLDIETLTRRVMSLEDGLRAFAIRYGLTLDDPAVPHVLEKLAPPWPDFPPDPTFDHERDRVMDALRRAAEEALAWLSRSGTDDCSGEAPGRPRQPLPDLDIGDQGG